MKDRECLPCRARRGHGLLARSLLLLSRSLVLATVLVVPRGQGRCSTLAVPVYERGDLNPRVPDCSYNCSWLAWISYVLCGAKHWPSVVVMGCLDGLVAGKCPNNHARNSGPPPSPRPGRLARGDGRGKGGAAIAERRCRRPCGRRHRVDDYWPRGRLYPAYRPARPPCTSPPTPARGSVGPHQEERSHYFSRFLNASRRPTAQLRPMELILLAGSGVASRQPGAARPRGAPGATSPPHRSRLCIASDVLCCVIHR